MLQAALKGPRGVCRTSGWVQPRTCRSGFGPTARTLINCEPFHADGRKRVEAISSPSLRERECNSLSRHGHALCWILTVCKLSHNKVLEMAETRFEVVVGYSLGEIHQSITTVTSCTQQGAVLCGLNINIYTCSGRDQHHTPSISSS